MVSCCYFLNRKYLKNSLTVAEQSRVPSQWMKFFLWFFQKKKRKEQNDNVDLHFLKLIIIILIKCRTTIENRNTYTPQISKFYL